ncbi:MAG: Hsp20/alpha crystallin family protein [Caldilineales bacterium]
MNDYELFRHLGLGRLSLLQHTLAATDGAFQPPVDVYESDDTITVTLEVAGLQEGSYEVLLDPAARTLTVVGRRQGPAGEGSKITYHRLEIPYGAFAVEVALPATLETQGEPEAVYGDGFLVVVLPKARARQISVRTQKS